MLISGGSVDDLSAAGGRLADFAVERRLAFGAFGALGLSIGIWSLAVADLAAALALSPAALGTALALGFLAIIPATLISGGLADRWGPNRLLSLGGAGIAGSSLLLTQAWSFSSLIGALVLFWAANGMYRVGCNAAGARLQPFYGAGLLVRLHAFGSATAAVGVLLAGSWLLAGLPFRWLYLVMAAGFAVVVLAIGKRRAPRPLRHGAEPEAVPDLPRAAVAGALVVVLVLTFGIMMIERSIAEWFGLFLRSSLNFSPLMAGVSLAGLYLAMATSRWAAPALIERLGRQGVLVVGGVVVAAGMFLALSGSGAAVVIPGLVLVGFGAAPAWPVTVSFAGDLSPGRAGRMISVTMTLGFAAGLLQPLIIGNLADATSLGTAMRLIVAAGLVVSAVALLLPQRLRR